MLAEHTARHAAPGLLQGLFEIDDSNVIFSTASCEWVDTF
jgi:hypothetical protein